MCLIAGPSSWSPVPASIAVSPTITQLAEHLPCAWTGGWEAGSSFSTPVGIAASLIFQSHPVRQMLIHHPTRVCVTPSRSAGLPCLLMVRVTWELVKKHRAAAPASPEEPEPPGRACEAAIWLPALQVSSILSRGDSTAQAACSLATGEVGKPRA